MALDCHVVVFAAFGRRDIPYNGLRMVLHRGKSKVFSSSQWKVEGAKNIVVFRSGQSVVRTQAQIGTSRMEAIDV